MKTKLLITMALLVFGSSALALSNRRCFLAQEIKLQAEILDIYSALQASLDAEKNW